MLPTNKNYTGVRFLTLVVLLTRLQAMSNSIKKAEEDQKIQALVISSSSPKIFCAGLELSELYKPDTDRLGRFWNAFQQLYLDLYGSRLTTLAAMGGHAPAAGCMLALSCDYRIFSATGGKIGLNESLLGIVAPPWLGQQYVDIIGHRRAEMALSLGTLFSPQEALEVGLVDEVAHDSNVVDIAKQRASEWMKIPMEARVGAKKLTRGRQLQHLQDNRQADADHFCSFVTQESVQKSLGMYIEQLSKKKMKELGLGRVEQT